MKKRLELLAPAGDFDSLKAAISNGANAIYIGGNEFSARRFAHNFNREELKEAVQYAHLRNVAIHVTVNTLYKDEEFTSLLDYLDYLYDIQVDALLIQDIGLLQLVKKRYPDFDIHVSTQMTVNSLEALRYFEELGVKRVVLARENTIEEMRYIVQHTSLEVEVFAHGAICVAYSGQCLMSSMIGKRSGNRGECAQPCRLSYQLEEDGHLLSEEASYLLSPRDLCTVEHVEAFIKAGVTSIKLEGRMKKPEYVGAIVKTYHQAIEHFYHPQIPSYSEEDYLNMKKMFNRHYTSGYAFHEKKIVDEDYSGNRGTYLGDVVGYSYKNKHVFIRCVDTLTQGDSITFTDNGRGRPVNKIFKKGKLVHQAYCGDEIEIEFDTPVQGGQVNKTVSIETIKEIQKTFVDHTYHQVRMSFYAYAGAGASLEVSTGSYHVEVSSEDILEYATHQPTSDERIKQQLSKLGGTVFSIKEIKLYRDDSLMIPISVINQLRRDAISRLEKLIKEHTIHHQVPLDIKSNKEVVSRKSKNIVVVSTLKQLQEVLSVADNVYYYYNKDYLQALDIFDSYGKKAALYLPRINNDEQLNELKKIPQAYQSFIVNDYGSYRLFKERDVIVGPGFNIYNHLSAQAFEESVVLSYECTPQQIQTILDYKSEVILPIYGKVENMISEHCVISQYFFHQKVPHCQKCQQHHYRLIDRKNVAFDIMTDEHCRNHILNAYPLYLQHYKKYPCSYFVFFTNEENVCQMLAQIESQSTLYDLKNEPIQTTVGYYK